MTISADIHLVFRALLSKNNDELGKKDVLGQPPRDFILERIKSGHCTGQGKIGQFGILDTRVANSLKIIGDASLKVTDLSLEHNHHHSEPDQPSSVNPEPTDQSVPSSSPSGRKWRSAW